MRCRRREIFMFLFFFLCLYMFFRYVQPIAPWDGDDWNTVMAFMAGKEGAFPESRNGYFTPHLLGTIAGMLSGFFVYPITGNYIMSYVIVGAFFLALSITLSLVLLYRLYFKITQSGLYSSIGIIIFFFLGFLIFKTKPMNEALYYRTNYCTIFFYELPSYLASALAVTLIEQYADNTEYRMDLKTGFILLYTYCLTFSFVPAAFILADVSFVLSVLKLRGCKNLYQWMQKCWIHIIDLIFFFIFLCFEFGRTFGTGYFKKSMNLCEQLFGSLKIFFGNFTLMHPLFCVLSVSCFLFALLLFLKDLRNDKMDFYFAKIFVTLLLSFFLTALFFILFGALDSAHIQYDDIIRMDVMYVYFFQMITIVTLCLIYILTKFSRVLAIIPLVVLLISFPVISSKNPFRIGGYDKNPEKNIPGLTAKLMSEVVLEIQERDKNGITSLVVHVPSWYKGYNGGACAYPLYRHHVTNHLCTIKFSYESDIDEPYFE